VAPNANASESTLVIVVDDDASVANSTCRLIRSLSMQCEAFSSGADLLNSGCANEASCLILDVRMPNLSAADIVLFAGGGYPGAFARDVSEASVRGNRISSFGVDHTSIRLSYSLASRQRIQPPPCVSGDGKRARAR
jgi:hypothetical protein